MRPYFIYLFIYSFIIFVQNTVLLYDRNERKLHKILQTYYSSFVTQYAKFTQANQMSYEKQTASPEFLTHLCDGVKNSTVLICVIDSIPIKRSQFTELG